MTFCLGQATLNKAKLNIIQPSTKKKNPKHLDKPN